VPSYTVGYIDVYRNGVRLVSTDFTATTGTTVVLANACTVGDAVVTESFYVSSVLNAIPATAGAISSTYLASNLTLGGTTSASIVTTSGQPAFFANYPGASGFATATTTEITGYDAAIFNRGSSFSSSTGRFTASIAGVYSFNAYVQWASSPSIAAGTILYSFLRVNGTTITRTQLDAITTGDSQTVGVALLYQLSVGDYVSLAVYQSSGGNRTINSGAFMGYLVG
jgi:hypothetical protein